MEINREEVSSEIKFCLGLMRQRLEGGEVEEVVRYYEKNQIPIVVSMRGNLNLNTQSSCIDERSELEQE